MWHLGEFKHWAIELPTAEEQKRGRSYTNLTADGNTGFKPCAMKKIETGHAADALSIDVNAVQALRRIV